MKQLDVEVFLKKQIMFEVLLKTLFTKTERFLIRNNKKFSLDHQEDSSSGDNDKIELFTKSKYFEKLYY